MMRTALRLAEAQVMGSHAPVEETSLPPPGIRDPTVTSLSQTQHCRRPVRHGIQETLET
jgi:hypothetical protein